MLPSPALDSFASVMCELPQRLAFPCVQVEDRLLAFVDNNGHADVSGLFRSSYYRVKSDRQGHDLGNLIAARNVISHVLQEFSADRVDFVRAVRKIPRVTILEFIDGGIDPQIPLP